MWTGLLLSNVNRVITELCLAREIELTGELLGENFIFFPLVKLSVLVFQISPKELV